MATMSDPIAESIVAAKVEQIDGRLAELEEERAALEAKREAYAPKKKRATAPKS
jgi:outer membrane murein-binding lipoprotein Lpp